MVIFGRLNPGEKVIALFRFSFIIWMILEVYLFCLSCPTVLTPWGISTYFIVTCLLMPWGEASGIGSQAFWSALDLLAATFVFLSLGKPVIATSLFYVAVVWSSRFLSVWGGIGYAVITFAVYALLIWTHGLGGFRLVPHFLAMLGLGIFTALFSETLRETEKEQYKSGLLLNELKTSFQEQLAIARELEKSNAKFKRHAIALEASQQELVLRNQELRSLTEVLRVTASTLDIHHLLELSMLKTAEFYEADGAFQYLQPDENDLSDLTLLTCYSISREETSTIVQKVMPILASLKTTLSWRQGQTPPLAGWQDPLRDLGITSFLAVPLVVSNQVVGMMALFSREANDLTVQAQEFINIISSQLSLALDKAILYIRLKQQAITDGLTELYNVRYFYERLREEIAKVDRKVSQLSLVMIDIDWFKDYNDNFGHQAGDSLLCKVATVLTNNMREGDVVARYGGEEFTVILPDTSHNEALVMAERLRIKFREAQLLDGGNFCQPVTLSLGVATYPDHADSSKDLVKEADRAMYQAKAQGKDRVCSVNIPIENTGE